MELIVRSRHVCRCSSPISSWVPRDYVSLADSNQLLLLAARNFNMAPQGNRLFLTICGGTALSMLTYGWDAGVLGGILETSAFQSSMGVS